MTSQDKLIAAYVALTGYTSAFELADALHIPYETARSWLKRLRRSNQTANEGEISPSYGPISPVQSDQPVQSHRSNQTNRSNLTGEISPNSRAHIHARAYKESSSKINNTSECVAHTRAQDTQLSRMKATPELVSAVRAKPEQIDLEEDIAATQMLDPQLVVTDEKITHTQNGRTNFSISLKAVEMATFGVIPMETIKSTCHAEALQWASEIEAGKFPSSVLPNQIQPWLIARCRKAHERKPQPKPTQKPKEMQSPYGESMWAYDLNTGELLPEGERRGFYLRPEAERCG